MLSRDMTPLAEWKLLKKELTRGAHIWGMGTRENSCQLGHHSLVVTLSVLIAVYFQFAVEFVFTVSRR